MGDEQIIEGSVTDLSKKENNPLLSTGNVFSEKVGTEVITDTNASNTEELKHTAMARERFLRVLLTMQKKEANFRMYENTNVNGIYEATDSSFQNVAVSNLQTPIAVYESASLRTSDILSFGFKLKL